MYVHLALILLINIQNFRGDTITVLRNWHWNFLLLVIFRSLFISTPRNWCLDVTSNSCSSCKVTVPALFVKASRNLEKQWQFRPH